ncbi:MAG: MBL fold metallo-hydrolase [Planctomycetes bacterium]|nr:MBL fold metallo-hydrolase [Planctomycetota bacterium]
MRKRLLILTVALAGAGVAFSGEHHFGEELMREWGADVDTTPVTSEQVAPGVHALSGVGGNVLAAIGPDGTLLVDDQFPTMVPKIVEKIRELGGDSIDFVINTHWHFDHADGNAALAETGSIVIAHDNSRQRLEAPQSVNIVRQVVEQPAAPRAGLPAITYSDRISFHMNGERIDVLYTGPAHTDGDAVVHLTGSNVVHTGDVFVNGSYPFIDSGNGGSLSGMLAYCEALLDRIDEDTVIVPGHGPIATYADLERYVAMLRDTAAAIAELVFEGKTLQEVLDARPTARWDEIYGDPAGIIDRGYESLSRELSQ